MGEQKLTIEIDDKGEIKVDLDGFKGHGCAAILDIVENALGKANRTNKPEYDDKTVVVKKGKNYVNI